MRSFWWLFSGVLLLIRITDVSAFTVNGAENSAVISSNGGHEAFPGVPIGSRVEAGTGADVCEELLLRAIRSTTKEFILVTGRLANKRIAGEIASLASRKVGGPARVLLVVNKDVSDSERILLEKILNAGGSVKMIDSQVDQAFAVMDGRHVLVGGSSVLQALGVRAAPITSLVLVWNDESAAHKYLEQWAEIWRKAREERS